MNEFNIIIPAIFEENNFPNKALADIHGKPMIQYVFECAQRSKAANIVIATNSPRVGMIAEDFDATVCMIVDEKLTGLSLLSKVAGKVGWGDDAVVVSFPADAPLIPRSIIQQVAENLTSNKDADCATLYSIVPQEIAADENITKLVTDSKDYVMYFSRWPIPHQSSTADMKIQYKSCIPINAYRVSFLKTSNQLPDNDIASIEKIEQLNLLYNGFRIHAAEANSLLGQRVITEDDIEKIKMQIAPPR